MRIWLITPFEPIPTETEARSMRAGMLAADLAERGHDVVWWTPDFEHYDKRHRTGSDSRIKVKDNYEVRLVKSLGYRSHVGPRRLLNNHLIARRWSRLTAGAPRPDLIFSAWPTPDLSLAAVRYGRQNSLPVVIDVRDLWPDLWLGILPPALRSTGRLILSRYYRMASEAMAGAAAITGPTSEYVDWALDLCGRARKEADRPFEFGFEPQQADEKSIMAARARLKELGHVPDDRVQVVFAGTFGRSFEFDTILEAGRRLDGIATGRTRIILCGSGDRWQQVADEAKGTDSLRVLPRLSLVELQQIYAESSFGLAPYRNIENFQKNVPNKINEYLRMGLPILSGVDGRMADLITQHGVGKRYLAGDPDSLARSIASLSEKPDEIETLRRNVNVHLQDADSTPPGTRALADHLEGIAERRS
jgi:glycosyltransferase involved in cell wall biosynthesis